MCFAGHTLTGYIVIIVLTPERKSIVGIAKLGPFGAYFFVYESP
jgi:hypothetical protein